MYGEQKVRGIRLTTTPHGMRLPEECFEESKDSDGGGGLRGDPLTRHFRHDMAGGIQLTCYLLVNCVGVICVQISDMDQGSRHTHICYSGYGE